MAVNIQEILKREDLMGLVDKHGRMEVNMSVSGKMEKWKEVVNSFISHN